MSNTTTISDYIPVSISTLQPSESAGINLYRQEDGVGKFTLYCAEDHPLKKEDLDRLHQRGVHRLFIESGCRDSFQSYLRDLINPEVSRQDVSLAAQVGALTEVVRDVLETQFRSGETDQTVSEAARMGAVTANIVCNDQFAASDMFRVLHHDYATFTHSANVAFYAGLLAAELGHDQHDVELMTTAGLLHDLGKLAIDEKILCKPGKLTDEEFDVIRSHPTVGFEQLNYREDLTEGQLMMVYQHHERLDGKGYPVGVVDSEIHSWAKICSVVDVYEALTSYRPYRSPMPRRKVFEIMERDSGKAFDAEVLACWLKIINTV
jgi:putative nucleotidyltransferase with HDIG domain